MRLTIDSAEPLDHVLRVVGSMYGMDLAITRDGQTPAAPKRSTSRTPKSSTPRRPKAAGSKRSPGRVKSPAPADVRAWAQDSGYQVAGRGRMPQSVLAAYHDAH